VSTTVLVGTGVCHGANWYDALISQFSFRRSNSVFLNHGRYRPRRQGQRAGTGHVVVTHGEANETWGGSTGELGRTGGMEGDGDAPPF